MNQDHAYPFLVSRNRIEDYRTIVAPQFLIDNKAVDVLTQLVGGDNTGDKVVFEQKVSGFEEGEITLIYRVVRAEKYHILSSEEGSLRDINGRIFKLIFGVILTSINLRSAIISSLLDEVETALKEIYSDYWVSQPGSWKTKFLNPFPLRSTNEDSDLTFHPRKDIKVIDPSCRPWKKFKEFKLTASAEIEKINYKGDTISTISKNGETQLLKIEKFGSQEPVRSIKLYNASCSALNPKMDLVAYGVRNDYVYIYKINYLMNLNPGEQVSPLCQLKLLNRQSLPYNRSVRAIDVSFSCDGKDILVVTDRSYCNFLIYRWESNQSVSLNLQAKCSAGAFHPNKANFFASGTERGSICLHEIDSKDNFVNTIVEGISITNNSTSINQLIFSTTGKFLVGISSDGSAQIINVDQKEKIHQIEQSKTIVQAVAFNDDDKLMILGELNGEAKIYSTETWDEISNTLINKEKILFCSFEFDGKYIYIFSPRCLMIWEKE